MQTRTTQHVKRLLALAAPVLITSLVMSPAVAEQGSAAATHMNSSISVEHPSTTPSDSSYRQFLRGYHLGYSQGYKDGPGCFKLNKETSGGSHVFQRGWARGYEAGFAKTYDRRMCPS